MPLTLLDLCLLIELVDDKLNELHTILNEETTEDRISDEAADLSVIYANTAGRLKELYKSKRRPDSNYPPYNDLISRKST